jgi:hypothetical protein
MIDKEKLLERIVNINDDINTNMDIGKTQEHILLLYRDIFHDKIVKESSAQGIDKEKLLERIDEVIDEDDYHYEQLTKLIKLRIDIEKDKIVREVEEK